MLYWKKRFTEQPITDFCSVIKTNSEGPAGKTEFIFALISQDEHLTHFKKGRLPDPDLIYCDHEICTLYRLK